MRTRLNKKEIDMTVDLLINKYKITTNFLNELYGKKEKSISEGIWSNINNEKKITKNDLCKLLVVRDGISLFATGERKKLRKLVIDGLEDEKIRELYEKYGDPKKNITTISYMKKPLSEIKWYSGKKWAKDFIEISGFPEILSGVNAEKQERKSSIEIVQPMKKIPELVDYQIEIKDKLLNVLKLKEEKTRCMIALPTGGGKTRVAVEAFLDWLQGSFEENKYMLWIAQSEELCEQCISCIEQMWRSREFILPLRIYRCFAKYNINIKDLKGGVVVASINKIFSQIKDDSEEVDKILSNVGAMIIDEAHRASTSMYDKLFDKAEEVTKGKLFPVCGLSATPGRNTIIGNQDLDKLVNRFQVNLIMPEFANEKHYQDNPMEYFKEQKYLSKIKHIIYESNIEYVMSEEEVNEIKQKGEYSQAYLKKISMDNQRNKLIINRLLKISKNEPTLVYACTIEHAKIMATMMNEFGRKADFIDSNTNSTERRIIIKDFIEGRIEFLFNFGVLTTGFDAPKTKNIVICRPINSNILYEQIVGRGIRGIRFGGTEECTVIDFSDNIHNLGKQQAYLRFKDYWDDEKEESSM